MAILKFVTINLLYFQPQHTGPPPHIHPATSPHTPHNNPHPVHNPHNPPPPTNQPHHGRPHSHTPPYGQGRGPNVVPNGGPKMNGDTKQMPQRPPRNVYPSPNQQVYQEQMQAKQEHVNHVPRQHRDETIKVIEVVFTR